MFYYRSSSLVALNFVYPKPTNKNKSVALISYEHLGVYVVMFVI